MRDIKFRAWIKDEKRMVDVDMEYATGFFYSNREDYELNQYTGLKDKNGREVYEGDIVKHEFYPADPEHGTQIDEEEIIYAKDGFGFKRGDDVIHLHECMSLRNDIATNLEIIGNIYEHKNLLK